MESEDDRSSSFQSLSTGKTDGEFTHSISFLTAPNQRAETTTKRENQSLTTVGCWCVIRSSSPKAIMTAPAHQGVIPASLVCSGDGLKLIMASSRRPLFRQQPEALCLAEVGGKNMSDDLQRGWYLTDVVQISSPPRSLDSPSSYHP